MKEHNEYTHIKNLRSRVRLLRCIYLIYMTLVFEASIMLCTLYIMDFGSLRQEGWKNFLIFLCITFFLSLLISLITLVIVNIIGAKKVIDPPHMDVREVEGTQLNNIVEEMCQASGLVKKPRVFIGENTSMLNAWVTEDKRHSYLVVTRPLLEKLNRAELQSVIGHEIGHLKSGDCIELTKLLSIAAFMSIVVQFALRSTFYHGNNSKKKNNDSGMDSILLIASIISFLFLIISPLIGKLIESALSRERELYADINSVRLTHNPDSLISSLRKLEEGNSFYREEQYKKEAQDFRKRLGIVAFYDIMNVFSTHPPLEERIQYISSLNR